MARLATAEGTTVFFEAPHRITETLATLGVYLGNRPICVGRELTKAHQEFVVSPASSPTILGIARKGEFSIVVSPPEKVKDSGVPPADADVVLAFRALASADASLGRRHAISQVAKQLGLSTNDVYQAIERAKT